MRVLRRSLGVGLGAFAAGYIPSLFMATIGNSDAVRVCVASTHVSVAPRAAVSSFEVRFELNAISRTSHDHERVRR
jgi:hypothetical protein